MINKILDLLLKESISNYVVLIFSILSGAIGYVINAIKKRKKPARIEIEKQSVSWGSGSTSNRGIPNPPLICRVTLRVNNFGDRSAEIKTIKVTNFDTDLSFVDCESKSVSWHREIMAQSRLSHTYQQITFPYVVEPSDRNTYLKCEIKLPYRLPHEEWPEKLKEFTDFSLTIAYEYEFSRRKKVVKMQKTMLIQGTFDDFRRKILKSWFDNEQYDRIGRMVDLNQL